MVWQMWPKRFAVSFDFRFELDDHSAYLPQFRLPKWTAHNPTDSSVAFRKDFDRNFEDVSIRMCNLTVSNVDKSFV